MAVWLVAATLYMAYDLWSSYQSRLAKRHYQAGLAEAVSQVIAQAEQSQCQPFEVYSGEKKVFLLDIQCLSKEPTGASDEIKK